MATCIILVGELQSLSFFKFEHLNLFVHGRTVMGEACGLCEICLRDGPFLGARLFIGMID